MYSACSSPSLAIRFTGVLLSISSCNRLRCSLKAFSRDLFIASYILVNIRWLMHFSYCNVNVAYTMTIWFFIQIFEIWIYKNRQKREAWIRIKKHRSQLFGHFSLRVKINETNLTLFLCIRSCCFVVTKLTIAHGTLDIPLKMDKK